MKLIDIRPVLRDERDGQREGARRIDIVVAKYLIVDRTSLEYLRLEPNLDGDSFSLRHGRISRFGSSDLVIMTALDGGAAALVDSPRPPLGHPTRALGGFHEDYAQRTLPRGGLRCGSRGIMGSERRPLRARGGRHTFLAEALGSVHITLHLGR
jgi:hypothetical protein